MPQTTRSKQPKSQAVADPLAELRALRVRIAERTKDLTEEEREALAAEIAQELKDGLDERLRTPAQD